MKKAAIKVGRWYETKIGVGLCIDASNYPAVKMRIISPIPWGERFVAPRDVFQEIPDPEQAPC